ncbi:hypothetical protein H310_05923 [Aphanomyces invadans]|uniref:Radial spoke head protein 9 homolog n=1 Tax=Aphanomyces invadans TaxID=157072 RepID=A0A024U979_9STRA|nr:hypothetical protein H310_05923 [Aphanomyces invadans]ETW02407.1 hypothetical protein H310_05923 [Aphanomyces invadans]|eukprot:XP_008869012.1 hypothetical protein H310_05923 [Aphanomyces invadans]
MELEHLDTVSRSIGSALTSQERSNLEIGFIKRNATENIESMRFWGRISGDAQDYLISVAFIESVDAPKKKFFFCTNTSPELQQFPEVGKDKRDKASRYTGRLKGDPSRLLDESETEPQEGENKNVFREVDRLVLLVEAIDNQTSLIPCGAYVVSATHYIVPNRLFQGLSWEKALQLGSYHHFRDATTAERKSALATPGLVRPSDFLDPLTVDLEGTWTLRKDGTGSVVVLRNLVFPGFVFFHKPRTGQYGSAYFGDGLRNPDLAFML